MTENDKDQKNQEHQQSGPKIICLESFFLVRTIFLSGQKGTLTLTLTLTRPRGGRRATRHLQVARRLQRRGRLPGGRTY